VVGTSGAEEGFVMFVSVGELRKGMPRCGGGICWIVSQMLRKRRGTFLGVRSSDD